MNGGVSWRQRAKDLDLIPDPVMAECRLKAQGLAERPTNWIAAAIIVLIWLGLTAAAAYWLVRAFSE